MPEIKMDERSRNLILAAEISGLIHDLGKLWPEFAREKMGEVTYRDAARELGFGDAHGAILEDKRIYPPASKKSWLVGLKQHKEWAQVLALPDDWVTPNTCQARGLGDPLRQHHATRDTIAGDRPTFLGDLYSFGADIRDSALDKGAGGTAHSEQRIAYGFIADSFGNENPHRPYDPKRLRALWLPAWRVRCPLDFVFQGSMINIETGRTKNEEDTEARVHGRVQGTGRQAGPRGRGRSWCA